MTQLEMEKGIATIEAGYLKEREKSLQKLNELRDDIDQLTEVYYRNLRDYKQRIREEELKLTQLKKKTAESKLIIRGLYEANKTEGGQNNE